MSSFAGLLSATPLTAFLVLLVGRLLLGLGESLVGVGMMVWGSGSLIRPARLAL